MARATTSISNEPEAAVTTNDIADPARQATSTGRRP